MSLSDKIMYTSVPRGQREDLPVIYVKQFIKELKEELFLSQEGLDIIDKKAGDKLT